MKIKTILLISIGFLVINSLIYQSCKKEKENPIPPVYTNGEGEIGGAVKIDDPSSLIKGTEVVIPKGALKSEKNIKIVSVPSGIFDESDEEVILVGFEPEGLTFGTNTLEVDKTNFGGNDCGEQTNLIYGGQTYDIVEIGNQCWMAENLNYQTTDSWWYNNSRDNGDIYGRLYTWNAALTACPSGWHLPSNNEWKTMEMALDMRPSEIDDTGWRGTDEGKRMKSTSGWNNNGNGTNSSSFNALPGGYRYSYGSFSSLGYNGGWWSSTQSSGTSAWNRRLNYGRNRVSQHNYYMTNGFSVRCLKD